MKPTPWPSLILNTNLECSNFRILGIRSRNLDHALTIMLSEIKFGVAAAVGFPTGTVIVGDDSGVVGDYVGGDDSGAVDIMLMLMIVVLMMTMLVVL